MKKQLNVKTINQGELLVLLGSIKGAKFCTIVTETEPKQKANTPFAGVLKKATTNVTLNANFGNSARRAGRTAPIQERKWGKKVGGSPLVVNKGTMYLHAKANAKSKKVSFHLGETELTQDDVKVLNTFITPKKAQLVPIVNYKIDNIKELKIDNTHLIIKD